MALLCLKLGVTTISCLNISNWIYYFFLIVLLLTSSYQFVLLNVGACYFGDLPLENFIRHLFITFSKPFKLILELIDLLVGTKSRSPHYFFVLHIVSNFVFSILLICQVKQNLRFKDLYVTGL